MCPPAACVGDNTLQNGPHCHAPIHPPAPVPTPLPHPPMPRVIMPPGAPTVMISNKPAARVSDQIQPCLIPGCVPGGPGMIVKGSATVKISNLPAARVSDNCLYASCVGPIPMPVGVIQPPGAPTVMING